MHNTHSNSQLCVNERKSYTALKRVGRFFRHEDTEVQF